MLQQKSFSARHYGPHAFPHKGPHAPKWYVIDAKDQVVGRFASLLATILVGKHKSTYTPHADTGDFVIVLNADKIVFTRKKWSDKLYKHHTGWIAGVKTFTAEEVRERDPERILRRAVWGMTNKSALARRQVAKLKLYMEGEEHNHGAQKPAPIPEYLLKRFGYVKGYKKAI